MLSNFNIKKIDHINLASAVFVWVGSFVVYSMTVAPTLSFWDCGEFIAASYILGVPHPPGTPLYILLGRIFSIIPFVDDIAVRINYLSVISSSFTALFGYFIIVRVLKALIPKQTENNDRFGKILIYGGGISGAFFTAFSFTNWINSVEAEVYGLAMLLLTAIVLLSLKYCEERNSASRSKYLLLIFFLAFAGIGVHMTTFLVIPAMALLFILNSKAKGKDFYYITLFFALELYLIFAFSSRPNEIPFFIPILIVMILYYFYIFSKDKISKSEIWIAVGFLLAELPLLPLLANNLVFVSSDSFQPAMVDSMTYFSTAVIASMVIYSLYMLYKYMNDKNAFKEEMITSVFILTALFMSLILQLPKGYGSFMVLSAMLAIILVGLLYKKINWSILMAIAAVSAVALGVKQHFMAMALAAAVLIFLGYLMKLKDWKMALMIILMSVLGYSVHLYIPIRSAHHPIINENNPSENLEATINFLERKQYGSQSMVERMFKRRAEWSNQFGSYRHMGFWKFFSEQYGFTGPGFIVVFFLGVLGFWETIRKKKEYGLPLLMLFLISSVGLILYMNFADGTRIHPVTGQDYLEVRERDYFFTPAFVLFGLAIGIGISLFIKSIKELLIHYKVPGVKVILTFLLVLFLLPVAALSNNYFRCDRSRNYMPFDYAYNILISAEKDAVLFTYGDNDTFPVWCLQEVYGIRKDVKNVNLSLANTKWYVKQIESTLGVNLGGLTDEQLKKMRPFRDKDGTVYRIQDQVINKIIDNNLGKRPINFSVSVSSGARVYYGRSLDSMSVLKGMVWDIKSRANGMEIDLEKSKNFYLNDGLFKYRGINDSTIYKNETTLRLTKNLANGMLMIADDYRRKKDLESAEEVVAFALEKIPYSKDALDFLVSLYIRSDSPEKLEKLLNKYPNFDQKRVKLLLSKSYMEKGKKEEAVSVLHKLLLEDQKYKPAFDELVKYYYNNNNIVAMRGLLKQWLTFNPGDTRMKSFYEEVQRGISRYEDSIKRSKGN